MRQRGQRPAYRAWLRQRPSLDRPEAPIRLLFAIEAGATLVVVALILTAVAVVGLHQPVTDPRDPPTAAALPVASLPPEVAPDDPSPSTGAGASATTVTTTTSPAITPAARGPVTTHSHPAPSPTHKADPVTPVEAHCLRASHVLNTQWPGGLQAQFTVANCGSTAVNGWVVSVDFSGWVSIQVWNALASSGSSSVDFGSVDYDSVIQPGASVTFGFNATWSGGGSRYITGCGVGYGKCS